MPIPISSLADLDTLQAGDLFVIARIGSPGNNYRVRADTVVPLFVQYLSAGSINVSKLTGTLPIINGGTGQTSAANAINGLLPSQTSNSGKFLTTNGTVASWSAVVTSVATDSTLTGGTITSTGTLAINLSNINTWLAKQTFNNINILSGSSSGIATMTGTGAGDMSINWQGVQGNSNDIRTGMQMVQPSAQQAGITTFPGACEWVIVGEGNNGDAPDTPYSRIEWGWQSAGAGWYSFHQESGIMPGDPTPATGGLKCRPITLGSSDHTLNSQCLHFIAGSAGTLGSETGAEIKAILTLGPPQTFQSLTGTRTFPFGAVFFGLDRYNNNGFTSGNHASAQYDGADMVFLGPLMPIANGHHDSHTLTIFGTSYNGSPHYLDWRHRVNVATNAGAHAYLLETQTDFGGYTTVAKFTNVTNPGLQLGTLANTSTATPTFLSLGATYSSSAGSNLKLKLYDDGSVFYGLGISTNSIDYVAQVGSHNFYIGSSIVTTLSTPSGNSPTSNFLNVTGTLPAITTNTASGVSFQITSNGSSAHGQCASIATLLAGYTGSFTTITSYIENNVASTSVSSYEGGNQAMSCASLATTTGTNLGAGCYAQGGNINYGAGCLANFPKSNAANIGVAGWGYNTGTAAIMVGGYFACFPVDSNTYNDSAAIIADNAGLAIPIALFQSNYVSVAAISIPNGGAINSNFFNITGTFPSLTTAQVNGVMWDFTTAGSAAHSQYGATINLEAGYIGSSQTVTALFQNSTAGTGNAGLLGGSGNFSVAGSTGGTTIGSNLGGWFTAANGNTNFACVGVSTTLKNSATNLGVAGFALNTGTSPIQVGGYFGLQNSIPTFASCALCADSGATSSPIALFRANGTTKITFDSAGKAIFAGAFQISTSPTNGYVLTSDASGNATWQAGGSGSVTSITAGSGLSGGTITTTGTISLDVGNSNTWLSTQHFNFVGISATITISSGASSTWDGFNFSPSTMTLTGGTNVTTSTGLNLATLYSPTITSASSTTVTNAATLAIISAPIQAGSVTITNAYSLWIQGGTTRFDGTLQKTTSGTVITQFDANGIVLTGGITSGATVGAPDVGFSRASANVWRVTDGSGSNVSWIQNTAGSARLAGDQTNSTTTFANISNSTINLVAGRKYAGRMDIKASNNVPAEGIKFDFNGGSATMTDFWAGAGVFASSATSIQGTTVAAALGDPMNFTTLGAGENVLIIVFSFICNAGGTLIPRFAEDSHTTGTATIRKGVNIRIEDLSN